ncbi:CHAD domain-containing protein [Acetobacter ascendens]|uniref:CHAD domain-containing protein n=1 Tax=Acetobacter ascendens TaxID=481146 RepID=A0A1Y0V052_9PROT|nr:CHAD domain-containing protein [Acetobacter ascendens]ARW11355.1 hypothetical protein S101447_02309 [Acetobacter ascendens]
MRSSDFGTGRSTGSVKIQSPLLNRQINVVDAFRAIVRAGLEGLHANKTNAEYGNAESVHQMRVAIRRLRTVLKLFGPALEPHTVSYLNAWLQYFGRILGEARDWDVFCVKILPTVSRATEGTVWEELLKPHAMEKQASAYAALQKAFNTPLFNGLLTGIEGWVKEQPNVIGDKMLTTSLSRYAPHLLGRIESKVQRRSQHMKHLSDHEMHELRKSLKELRYSAEYFSALYPPDAMHLYLKRCKRLLEYFGDYNDAATTTILGERLCSNDPTLIVGLSALASWSKKRKCQITRHLPAAWKKFTVLTPFWH